MISFFTKWLFLPIIFVGQKLKTSVKKHNVNPVWNEDLTLSVTEPLRPIKLVCAYLCLYNLSTLLANKLYRGHEEFACYEQIEKKKKNPNMCLL